MGSVCENTVYDLRPAANGHGGVNLWYDGGRFFAPWLGNRVQTRVLIEIAVH